MTNITKHLCEIHLTDFLMLVLIMFSIFIFSTDICHFVEKKWSQLYHSANRGSLPVPVPLEKSSRSNFSMAEYFPEKSVGVGMKVL